MLYAGIIMILAVAAIGLIGPDLDPVQLEEPPDAEVNVTCYTWSENGTAHANCLPKKVWAPDAVVNVTVMDCAEWTPKYSGEFARDRPCGPDFQRRDEDG